MRIGFIIYDRLETLTGGYIYDNIVTAHLRRLGHQVDIIPLARRYYARNLFYNLKQSLNSSIIESSFDLLLQDGLCHPSLFILNKRLKSSSKLMIVSLVHQVLSSQLGSGWQHALYRRVERQYLASVDAFIFNSHTTRQFVEGLIGPNQPSVIAYPAGDRLGCVGSKAEIKSRAQKPGPLELLFLGNVLPNKGLRQLIEALSCLPSDRWHLTVVGSLSMDTAYVRQVKKMIIQRKLFRQIDFTGSKDESELTRYLSGGQVLLMPFSHEGFGIAYIEGMAFGLPAIGSAAGAAKEIIRHGQNGFLLSPGDHRSLLKFIHELYDDRDRLAEMSGAAFDTFRAHPSWQDTAHSIAEFLEELVN